ncbi:hypothetical protein SLE2022_196530 [Rubroshorea leprosula]
MSFQNKSFWMLKGSGLATDGEAAFDNSSRIKSKRAHNWFIDSTESRLFPNKKHAPNSEPHGISNSSPPWENNSSFQSVPNQFIDRLFGSESGMSVNYADRDVSHIGTDNVERKDIDDHFDEDASVGLSMSNSTEDPETSFSYGGIRKVKVNRVMDSDNVMQADKEHNMSSENNSDLSTLMTFSRGNESSFISMAQSYDKEYDNITLMGHNYNKLDGHVRPTAPAYGKGDEIPISMGNPCSKEDVNVISFGGFHEEHDITATAQPVGSYEPSFNQSKDLTLEPAPDRQLGALNAHPVSSATWVAKSKAESLSRSKSEFKSSKKEAPNSFPSNVRSLISTGMLDGVPVKYASLSREELRGTIKGSGYLCGCQSCNYSKVLNAYEFERHAGCKTKHPNNHIYFENGKTIYQIVQELRSTPESSLFDAIQTVFGAPINQKSFRIWKESYQAATRELQRIYGKEELNL